MKLGGNCKMATSLLPFCRYKVNLKFTAGENQIKNTFFEGQKKAIRHILTQYSGQKGKRW
jgi:hypothetical protein